MQQLDVPPTVTLEPGDHLAGLVTRRSGPDADAVLLRRHLAGEWVDVTAAEWQREVVDLARGLLAAGIGAGDRVALMSRTRYEWTLFDFALWSIAAVVVPVYETSSADQLAWILADSGAVGLVVEHGVHAALAESARQHAPDLRHVWVIDDDAVAELASGGTDVTSHDLDLRRATLGPDSTATLIYTSGTTGRPKGVELTHGNLLFDARSAVDTLNVVFDVVDASTLLFLPLAHVFARVIQVGCIDTGTCLGHAPDITRLPRDLQEFRPTFVLAVPRVFEKIYNGAANRATVDGKRRVFTVAAATAIAYSEGLERGRVSPLLHARHALLDRLVYRRLRDAMGGNVQWAVSGGAALGTRLGHFFRGVGITVLEGYGLTETSAASTLNTPGAQRVGSVGRPLPGTGVAISGEGEVWLRGPNVMRGYWNQPEATAQVLDADGWFRTGDLGSLDEDGYLTITGRTKEIIVTAGGKNVAPAVLEDRLRSHPLVSQAMVVGDGRPYVAALVTLDADAVAQWCEQQGGLARPTGDVVDQPALVAEIQAAVDAANQMVSKAESIRRFRVLREDFSEASGELTATLKVRRHVVMEHHHAEVEALYA